MAHHDAIAVIKKAASDDIFRNALSADFDKTVATHHVTLTPEEHTALKGVDWQGSFAPAAGKAATWVHIYK